MKHLPWLRRVFKFLLVVSTTGALPACQTLGPGTLSTGLKSYNEVMSTATDEQLLLNVVRVRYRDAPYFLDVAGVTASQTLAATASLGFELNPNWSNGIVRPGAGVSYSQTPTISYVPLEGTAFLKRLLAPIPVECVLVLSQSGWNAERLLGVAVERVNDLDNAASGSGPTPAQAPRVEEFRKFAGLWALLQRNDRIQLGANPDNTREILVRFRSEPHSEEVNELKHMLGLPMDRSVFRVGQNFLDPDPAMLRIRTRSIMAVLFLLSQTVEVPEPDRKRGLVAVTHRPDHREFDWQEALGRLFSVKSADKRPPNAYLAVPYRGHWFYIPDDDLETKSTFLLIDQLFNLQGGQTQVQLPTLTLPVSR